MAVKALFFLCCLLRLSASRRDDDRGRTVYLRACSEGKIVVPPVSTRMPANFTMQWILRAPRGKQIRLFFRELELRMIGHGGCKDALAMKNGYPPFEESSQVICGAWDNTEVLGEYRMTLRIHIGGGSIIPRDVGMYLEYSCVNRKDKKATAPCPGMFPCSASVKDYLRWTECQPLDAKCDGIDQCPNGEDERKCPSNSIFDPLSKGLGSECPSKTLFKCAPHSCIPRKWVCDGRKDCDNGADEKRSKCRKRKTKAKMTTIPTVAPTKAPKRKKRRCSKRKFLCPKENVCIRKKFVCDGLKDCDDGADEAKCATTVSTTIMTTSAPKHNCRRKEFYCADEGVCIDRRFVCDDFEDCSNGEDEKNCKKNKRPQPTKKPKREPSCGRKKFPPKGSWYWNLVVERKEQRICAAVLIDETIALTTAHCAKSCIPKNSGCEVLLASRLRKRPKAVRVIKVILHPDFEQSGKRNDLALLHLEEPFGRKARPLCLALNKKMDKSDCYITGFGSARRNRLKQASVKLLPSATCSRINKEGQRLSRSEFCISYSSRKLDVCDKESGAPLSCFDREKERWFLGGIAVWELRCNSARKFDVIQNLNHFKDWITNSIKRLKKHS